VPSTDAPTPKAPDEVTPKPPAAKGLWRWFKRTWRKLKREQLSPGRFGAAVGLGIFWGLSPFWGLQTIVAMVFAQVFRLNKLAVIAGVTVSAPPFLPFEVLASIQLGQRIIYGRWSPLTLDSVRSAALTELVHHYFSSFVLGALVLAAICSVPAGLVAAKVMQVTQARRLGKPTLTDDALDALDDALPALPRKFRHYASWKVRLDPVYPLVLPSLVGRREVVDLGAGMGLLAFFLRQASGATRVRCVEWDAEKADVARKLLGESAEVQSADARTAELGSPDAIVLMDVLHYNPIEDQRAWLERCASSLQKGGVLVVRELDPEASRTSANLEQRAVKNGWNKGAGVYPWPLSQMQAHLEGLGLTVSRTPAGAGLFSANALLLAHKP
jgi:uncharacterized protein (DUF2062 family)/2-polyprenyl-3-methyl-5-hydroxy-6-metoxy-1,4-benzoquinol methylase